MRMQVAVLLVAVVACVLGDKLPSGEVIARTVSVKAPERKSSVISHFTPADHRYEATGSVLIAPEVREPPKPIVRTYSPPVVAQRAQAPAPKKPAAAALTRTVKVKTPVRVPTVISHFVPADHRYEAEGSVTIVKGSGASGRRSSSGSSSASRVASQPAPTRRVKVERKLSASSQSSSNAAAAAAAASAAKLALTRTVSVKSPNRVPTVISHFVPAEHQYEATGSVTIAKGSQGSSRKSSGGQAQFVSQPAPTPRRPAPAPKRPAAPAPARKASASNLALTRTVSVKSPKREPTVISHFVPAEHQYEATGSVTIGKEFQSSSRGSSTSQAQFVSQPAPTPRRPAPAPKRPAAPAPAPARKASSSNLALTRTVSVKSPKRDPTVISHFVPAEHQYEATGSVTIAKGSQSSARGSSSSQAQFVSQSAPAPTSAPVRQVKVKKTSRPLQTSAASSAAGLALTRTVNVKSPDRVPTVISHFVPAEHRYEATGSVTIAKGSQGATRKVSSGSGSSAGAQVSFKPSPAPSKPSRRVETVRKSSSASSANLGLTRTVSVKSPDKQSSVISHFLPADHHYEATGSVTIGRGSSGGRQSAGFSQSSSGSSQRVSGGSSSFGASGGSLLSAFGQGSGRTVSKASGSQSGSVGGASFGSASGKASGSSVSFSGSSKAASSGQSSSGRVSFGASQAASGATFGQASGSSSQAASLSASKKASASSGRAASSSARKQSSASSSQSSAFGASASAQRSQASAASAAAAAAARARDSSSESFSYRLAEPYRGGSSVSSADLLAELKAFREDAARSGVKISHTKQSGRDDGSGSDPYNFSIRVEDSSSTNYQSRDEWVGADGVTYGWYTMLMPDGFFYNYTYTSHPVKGYQVKVLREDSGIALEPVKSDIFAPATIFSDQGIGRFADFAISGVNNDYEEEDNMSYEENAAAMFADSLAEAQKVEKSSSTKAAVNAGPLSHICGHRIVRERGSRTSGSRTTEGLVFGPCTFTQEATASGSASRGSFASGGSSSGSASAGSSSSFASKASGSASRSSSSSTKHFSSGAASSSSSSFGSSAFASKTSGSASHSSSQDSGSAFRAASKTSGSAFGSASQGSGSAFGSSSKASGSAFGSTSRSSGSASAFGSGSKTSGSAFGSGSKTSDSAFGSGSKTSGSAFGSGSKTSDSAFGSGSKTSDSAFGSGSKTSGSAFGSGSKTSDSAFRSSSKTSGSAFGSASKTSGSGSGSASRSGSSGSSGASSTSFFQSAGSAASSSRSSSSGSSGAQFFGSAGGSRSGSSGESGSGRFSSGFAFQTSSRPSSSEEKESRGFFKIVREDSGSSEEGSDESFSKFQSSSSSFSSGFSSSRSGGDGSGGSLTRRVSVKSPVRQSSVISHFSPAEHVYDATAGVTIGSSSVRQSSTPSRKVFVSAKSDDSASAARKAAEAALAAAARSSASRSSGAASGGSLTRRVSVKSPVRQSSVISHFSPAEHVYDATAGVTIGSSSVRQSSTPSRKVFVSAKSDDSASAARKAAEAALAAAARSSASRSSGAASGGSLTRKVSVKSPVRQSSVISHFLPAEHVYDATAGVTIGSSSVRQSSTPSRKVFVSAQSDDSASAARKAAEAALAAAARSSASRSSGGASGGSLTRRVSVKSPVRQSSVISHFLPAEHVYDATAGVTIGSSSVRQSSTPSRKVFVSAKSDDSASAARKAAEAALAAASRSAASRDSKLALTRTVAVKSPQRHTSVISHFVPAEHQYEAVGSVTINRESEKSASSVTPVRTVTVKSSPAPAPVRDYGPPSRSASPSKLALTRTVNVKSPERKSSVISHFTPAEHVYEATGSVTINRASA